LPVLGRDLREVLYPAAGASDAAAELLKQTAYAQTALFAVEYALAQLMKTWGLAPTALIGHSVGEWVAAAVAGVMAPKDAMQLVAQRGRLMQAQPAGAMLSVRASADEVLPLLPPTVSLASDNAPRLCVVSGPDADIATLERSLTDAGLVVRRLETSHAFHSAMMDPVVEPMRRALEGISLHAPAIPIVSSCTGKVLTAAEATSPDYWARHLREPVRFRQAVTTLAETRCALVSVGPRTAVATLLRQNIPDRASLCLPTLGDLATPEAEWGTLLGTIGSLWASGVSVAWGRFHELERRRRIPAPTYAFDHVSHWLEPAQPAGPPAQLPSDDVLHMPTSPSVTPQRVARLIPVVRRSIEDFSGLTLGEADDTASFVQLGLDSLALTQVATEVQKELGVKLTFRMLMEEHTSIAAVASYVDGKLPPEVVAPPAATELGASVSAGPAAAASTAPIPMPATYTPTMQPQTTPMVGLSGATGGGAPSQVRDLIDQQLRVMAMQLQLLGGSAPAVPDAPAVVAASVPAAPAVPPAAAPMAPVAVTEPASVAAPSTDVEAHTTYDVKKAFGAMARISTSSPDVLTPLQRASLDSLIRRYTARTPQSKARTEQFRGVLADPRVVTGFRPLIKEMIYPLVVDRSKGARLWDIDGNEYIDALNGFGSNLFGHSPEFVLKAMRAQLELGYELGPMNPLAQEVAALMCDITGFDRAGLCNTGSEAVMGCMRIARTVTGRSLIAIFSGSYHGIFDEVIVRGTKRLRSVPASPGIMQESVENVLVLDYGTDETLEILRARAHELAAVMVEPIQSRRPDFQPGEFLRQVRTITEQHGTAFIFDEVITGFRMHQRGAQELFGVRADLASYGKIVGGGQPIGVVAGKREWMDALDGGHWQFGDASTPTVGVTYFAGTFVRHPLALAAAKAVLTEMKMRGPALQDDLNARCAAMAADANSFLHDAGVPMKMKYAGSLWKLVYTEDQTHGDLLFAHMRDRGIHIWDGFPCFLTTAFTDADIEAILTALRSSVIELQQAGFLPGTAPARWAAPAMDATLPPVPGARLGRDPEGNPAWYAPHPTEAGQFVVVGR
jgi:glutamate-1-semialdehyde aminotransferase/malonyl CoA-acyl carrier protein transacylase